MTTLDKTPFDHNHADPWSPNLIDVPGLNARVSDAMVDLVQRVRLGARAAGSSLRTESLLVLGPAGAGKTHLFARLRRKIGPRAVLVHLRPLVGTEITPRYVLHEIDEFQDLTAEKATAKPFFDGVKRLGPKARAAGVHVVLATQRPDRETVPGLLRANLGGRIALRVASTVNSRIILDEAGAEKLLGKGDLLANLGHGTVRAQAALVS